MTINMHLNSEAFEEVKKGSKTFEIRLYDEKRRNINIGDEIIFTNRANNSEKISTKVIELTKANSFDQLFQLLHSETPQSAANKMYEFYSQEEENKFGVVAIHFELV